MEHYFLRMFFSTKTLVLFGTILILWMLLQTFTSETSSLVLLVVALILGTVQFFKIPQLDDEKIGNKILKSFQFDEGGEKRNIIYHKGGASHAPANTIEAIQQVNYTILIEFKYICL